MKRSASAVAVAAGTVAFCLLTPPLLRHVIIMLGALLARGEAERLMSRAFGEAPPLPKKRMTIPSTTPNEYYWDNGRLLARVMVVAFACLGAPFGLEHLGLGTVFVITFLLGSAYLFTVPKTRAGLGWFATLTFSAAWVGFPAAALIELSKPYHQVFLGEGGLTLLFLLAVVMVGEAGAYICGKAIGRSKLAPSLSPGKTWAGFWGQLIVSAGTAALAAPLLTPSPPLIGALILGVWLGAAAAVGDLFASYWKRAAGAKDSGRLIPGHGGLLDRVDGILFAALAFVAAREVVAEVAAWTAEQEVIREMLESL